MPASALPLAMVKFWTVNATPSFTENTPTLLPPLSVIRLLPSMVVSVLMFLVLVTVIVTGSDPQLNVAVPVKSAPPGRQASSADSVQVALVPAPTMHGRWTSDARAPTATAIAQKRVPVAQCGARFGRDGVPRDRSCLPVEVMTPSLHPDRREIRLHAVKRQQNADSAPESDFRTQRLDPDHRDAWVGAVGAERAGFDGRRQVLAECGIMLGNCTEGSLDGVCHAGTRPLGRRP